MFKLSDSLKEQLLPFAKQIIEQNLDDISCPIENKITLHLIRKSKAQKAYEQELIISEPINLCDLEFLVLRAPINDPK